MNDQDKNQKIDLIIEKAVALQCQESDRCQINVNWRVKDICDIIAITQKHQKYPKEVNISLKVGPNKFNDGFLENSTLIIFYINK